MLFRAKESFGSDFNGSSPQANMEKIRKINMANRVDIQLSYAHFLDQFCSVDLLNGKMSFEGPEVVTKVKL